MVGLVVSWTRDTGVAHPVRPQHPESQRQGVPGTWETGEGSGDSRQRCQHAAGTLGPQGQTPTRGAATLTISLSTQCRISNFSTVLILCRSDEGAEPVSPPLHVNFRPTKDRN